MAKKLVNHLCRYTWGGIGDDACRHHQGNKNMRALHRCNEIVAIPTAQYEEAIADRNKRQARLQELVQRKHNNHRCSCGAKEKGWGAR